MLMDCSTGLCKVAYRIEFDPAKNGGTALPALGASTWPPSPADYSTVISYDLYRRQDAQNTCLPNELFVTAMNKASGSVTCVRPATRTLASSQLGKTMEYDIINESIEFRPKQMAGAACPTNYVLQQVNPASLEYNDDGTAPVPQGRCVYRYKSDLPWMETWPAGKDYVEGNMCPNADYDAVPNGACAWSVIPGSDQNGWHQQICGDGGGTPFYDCSAEVPVQHNAHVVYNTAGHRVRCELIYDGGMAGQGGYGASWRGQVSWGGRCVIKPTVPQTLPAAL
jgi:hypothetical protein